MIPIPKNSPTPGGIAPLVLLLPSYDIISVSYVPLLSLNSIELKIQVYEVKEVC